MSIVDSVSPMVARFGMTVTYRRVSGNSYNVTTGENQQTTSDSTIKAAVRDYRPSEMIGNVQQGDRKVVIPAADIAFTPAKGDSVSISSKYYKIEAVNHRVVGDQAAVYILQVRG